MESLTRPSTNERSARRCAAIFPIVLALMPASVCGAEIIDRVLAVVSGEIITQSDVQGALALGLVAGGDAPDPVAAALRELIERTLILTEVRRFAPPEPDEAAIEQRIARMRQRLGSLAAQAQALAAAGLDEERLRVFARDDLRITAYLAERFRGAAQPSEQEVDQYLRDHPKELVRDGRALSPDDARDLARQQLAGQRREASIAEWKTDLRRRADVTELYLSR